MIQQQQLVLLLLLSTIVLVSCSKAGDFVPMLKRVQYKFKRTEWSEVLPSQAPRFGIHKTVYMRGPAELTRRIKAQLEKEPSGSAPTETGDEDNVKIAFAFDRQSKFATPWITITAQKDHQYLTQIDFVFRHTGDTIRDVKYHEHYTTTLDEEEGKLGGPKRIRVNYHWHEIVEKDTTSALTFLFLFSFVSASVMLFVVLSDISFLNGVQQSVQSMIQ